MKTDQNTLTTAINPFAQRKLYFIRVAFSAIWVTLVALFTRSMPLAATILLVIYPAWDVVATAWDISINKGQNLTAQYVNTAISVIVTIAVAIASQSGVPAALIVFGIWAGLTGIIQLITGLQRRKQLDGQWPMIISGGQSLLAGVSFIVMAHQPGMGIVNLAGYSAFGAFYFLLAGIRVVKNTQRVGV
ncbi:DUF308 domain-containing protein [Mucilaginibacter ginsenosidivorax]|uniref:DUF308 domain-containing protein n=1 Tax=Mucilaginibacter ginsenosidivorax TaxID=862126 RepID=A0A5B8W7D8_9SPHI|nr:DUF308 domain-containing protein [Mucilaginibacter ginsenosidivorax]QEC79621.1 hypothetical protein FSB76_28060 [Mucilaginibacter ginsenosidivorax]